MKAGPSDDEARHARLIDWAKAHGARVNGIAITGCDGHRGLRTEVDLAEGEEAIFMPAHLLITSRVARGSLVGQRLAALAPDASETAYLALHLLALRRENGFWQPYIDLLPTEFPSHPLSYGAAEMLLPDPRTAVACFINAVHSNYREAAAQVEPVLAEQAFTAEEFRWAYTCVRSRAFRMGDGESSSLALAPLVDTLDHAADPDLDVKSRKGQRDFILTTRRGMAGGSDLTTSYGDFGNIKLLGNYGFCLPENPWDRALLILDGELFVVRRRYDAIRTGEMFRKLRLSTGAPPSNLVSLDVRSPCGVEHEFHVLQKLYWACETALGLHLSSLADDDPLRAAVDPRSGLGTLLQALASEQAVLRHWMLLACTAGRLLCARADEGEDMALLRSLDQDYAGQIAALIRRDRDAHPADAAAATGSA